jgi:hypothetical protein
MPSVPLALSILVILARLLPAQTDSAAPILSGLSNQGRHRDQPYVAAGDRAYLIGTQDGNFPDMGGHVPGEMGGLWLHPIKLVDGFWATVTDSAAGQQSPLSDAVEFINYPYGNRLRYGPVVDSLEVDRFQFSPDGRPGVVVQYTFHNRTARPRALGFEFSVKTDLRPVWYSEHLGIRDAADRATWYPRERVFLARDRRHPWFAAWGATPSADAAPVADPDSIRTRGLGVTAASRPRGITSACSSGSALATPRS